MALRNIKNIIKNRGYYVSEKDRAIFEKGDLESFFGFSKEDAIEFILYDVNNNQLPQQNNELVRYISLTNQNIRDYFLVQEGTLFQRNQLPTNYFIDVERLLLETGYTNGIFKTQVTLLNRRVGSEATNNKLWIKDISPSRTEIRVLPLSQGLTSFPELQPRYNAFVNGSEFREDVAAYIYEFIESIKPTEIRTYLISKYTLGWLETVISEFKIPNFETFVTTIYNKFVEASIHEFSNRISDITDVNYGKPKSTPPSITLSRALVMEMCKKILVQIINFYLSAQTNRSSARSITEFNPSTDPVSEILQSAQSDVIFNSKPVEIKFVQQGSPPNITEAQFELNAAISLESGNTPATPVTPDGNRPYSPTPPTPGPTIPDNSTPSPGPGRNPWLVPGENPNVPVP
jgi:hypothetical protein